MSNSLAELAADRMATLLNTQRYGRSYELLAQTASTNDDARKRAEAGVAHGHVVVADQQTAGRGSHGRNWLSPGGTDLYFSIVDRVDVPMAQLPPLTLAVGLGAAEALATALTGDAVTDHAAESPTAAPATERARVKWPNDVWLDDAKCAGVLVEVGSNEAGMQTLVIGVGVNVNRQTFPEGLEHPPTSLSLATGRAQDRGTLLAALLFRIEHWVRRFEAEGPTPVVRGLNDRLLYLGEEVSCGGANGRLLGISDGGELRLATPTGEQSVLSGRLRRR